MKSNYLKFKRRARNIRILKAALSGSGLGFLASGVFLILSRLAIIEPEPIWAVPIGVAILLIAGTGVYAVLTALDKNLAARLDCEFGLSERVQTMLYCEGDEAPLAEMQREDTELVLSKINVKQLKPKLIWIYIVVLALGAALFTTSLVLPSKRNAPDPVLPFSLTPAQEAGLNELISYVDASEMDEQYRTLIVDELARLLGDLKLIDTMPDMQARLAKSMAYILNVTYDCSNSTEILNALWDSGDVYLRYLAQALDTSEWTIKDTDEQRWGDYAEKLSKYIAVVLQTEDPDELSEAERRESVLSALSEAGRKLSNSLVGLSQEEDELLKLLALIATADGRTDYGVFDGFSTIAANDTLGYEEIGAAVNKIFDALDDDVFAAVSKKRTNALVGEYAMTRLSALFVVPLPEFERPDFFKFGYDAETGGVDSEKDDEDGGSSDGGVGEGATFGSKDLVLDPMSGNYVEYGTLIDKYYALVFEKISNGEYTQQEQEMIEKYFALLYGGMEKEEG